MTVISAFTADRDLGEGGDYSISQATLDFPAGSNISPKCFSVAIAQDTDPESTETFEVTLSGFPQRVSVLNSAQVEITDDDSKSN